MAVLPYHRAQDFNLSLLISLGYPYPPPFPVNKHSQTAPCNQSIKPHLILLICLPLLVRHLSKNLKLRSKELSPLGVQFLPKLGLILCRCPTCAHHVPFNCDPCKFCTPSSAPPVHSFRVLWGPFLGCQLWRLCSPVRYEESHQKRIHQNAALLKDHTPASGVGVSSSTNSGELPKPHWVLHSKTLPYIQSISRWILDSLPFV